MIEATRDGLQNLTVCVICRNEVTEIEDFLYSIPAPGPRIVLIDDFSQDGTFELVRDRFPAVSAIRPTWTLPGQFASLRNLASQHVTTTWEMHVDVDMRFSSEFWENLSTRLLDAEDEYVTLSYRLTAVFLGRPLKHGLVSRDQRNWIFRGGNFCFSGDVHEKIEPTIPGSVARFKTNTPVSGRVLHLTDRNYEDRLVKSVNYTLKSADTRGLARGLLSLFVRFVVDILVFRSFLDGRPGIIYTLHGLASGIQRLLLSASRRHIQASP